MMRLAWLPGHRLICQDETYVHTSRLAFKVLIYAMSLILLSVNVMHEFVFLHLDIEVHPPSNSP